MKNIWILMIVALLSIAATGFAQSAEPYVYKPADFGQFVVSTNESRQILPHRFLREYDPVTLFFTSNQVDSAGPEVNGEKYISITPKHAGEYIWIDKKTLEFRPTTPWPPITWFSIRSGNAAIKLQTLLSPPKRISPSNSARDIGAISEVNLTFSHEVALEKLEKLVSFEVTPLPGIDRSQSIRYSSADYRIKPGETANDGSVKYSFIFEKPFPLGHKVRTHVKVSDIPDFEEGSRSYSFDTKTDFRPVSAGSNGTRFSISSKGSSYSADQAIQVDRNGVLVVEFSSAIKSVSLSQAKSFFNFSPSPNSFSYSVSGNRIIAEVDLDPERIYKVTLQPIFIKDRSNRSLIMDAPSSYYVYRNADRSYIRWAKGYSIMELNGPQHLPMEISNVKSFDLRIHKIDPLNKAFWPFPNSSVPVDEKILPPGPGEEPQSESEFWDPLSKSEMVNHLRMLGSPHYSSVIDVSKEGILRNQSLDLSAKLRKVSKGKPGAYLIGFRELKNSSTRYFVKVLVTDLCLSTVESKNEVLFTVTSYKTGKPVANAKVEIEGVDSLGFRTLFTATTDKNGFCKAAGSELYRKNRSLSLKRVVVSKGDDQLVLNTRNGLQPPSFKNNHWSSSYSTWLDWISKKPYSFSKDVVYRGFVCTERPIYRPNDSIFVKGYVRSLLHGNLSIPQTGTLKLKVTGPNFSTEEKLPISKYGSYDFNFVDPDEGLPTGDYRVTVSYNPKDSAHYRREIAHTSFRVDAYRIPRFEVKVTAPQKVPNDRPFSVNLVASYYAGGPVIDGDVRWRVAGYPYNWSARGWEEYMLSSDSRFGGNSGRSSSGTFDEVMSTDDDGGASLIVQPQSVVGANPMKFVVEGTVTDVDEQTVTDSRTIISLPPYVLGLKTDRFVRGGNKIAAKIVAIGHDEKLVKGQEVSIALKKMSWNSYLQETDFARSKPRFITDEQVHLVEERTITTGTAPVDLLFENRDPGVYIIECTSTDKLGRRQTLKIDLFLSGEKPVVWKKSEQRVFETVTGKSSYVPGEKAEIILKSPYQNGRALAVVEMPDGRPEYHWVNISKGQAVFDLEITQDMIPHIPVSFLVMRPRISEMKYNKNGQAVDPGKPETVANTTWIKVKPAANRVSVSLKHDTKYTPGDTMEVEISLKDWKGKAVSGEVALWLVDKAVLSLGTEGSIDPLKRFIPNVSTHVTIRDSRNMVLGMLGDFETPGGDGGEYDKEKKEEITVRKNFKTVPYYNASIKIDKSGKAKLIIPLPDNLTRFAVRAVAVSSADKFGSKKSEIMVRLPVIVQPMLPRFVRVGDTINAGGIARVVEGSGGEGLFSLTTDGLDVVQGELAKWNGFTFPGKKAQPVTVKMSVPAPAYTKEGTLTRDSVSLQMAVRKKTEKGGDAFLVSIPILPDRHAVTRETVGMISRDSLFTFDALPEPARDNTLVRKLMVSSELPLLKALGALRYLLEYPHGCAEQRVSRAYPALAYQDLWIKLGEKPFDPKLDDAVKETINYLAEIQNDDGLFSYWPGGSGNVYLTAYVVEFLALVEEINGESNRYPIDPKVYSRSIKALEKTLRSDYTNFISGYKYYSQAAAAIALARAGKTDISYFRTLAEQSSRANPLSIARIYQAVIKSGGKLNDQQAQLEKKLWNSTVFKLRDGKEVFAGMQSGSTKIGAEVHGSEINEIAGVMGALSLKNKQPEKVRMIRDDLVAMGKADGWGNTHVNSQVLLALRDNIQNSKKVSGAASLKTGSTTADINLKNDKVLSVFTFEGIDSGTVSLKAESKSDTLFTKLFERYLPKSLGSSVEAQQNGFVVKRELILPALKGVPSKRVPLDSANTNFIIKRGTIIEEHIQVTNPKKRHYVAVVIPLAAGVEYLNPTLKTAAADFKPDGSTSDDGDYQMFLDDRIVYYFNSMSAGTYDFYFRTRATIEGTFTQPPAYAEMMYREVVNGNSPGARIIVEPRPEKK